ncbi:CFI-box-CTERM domain-containing protein [Streptomyces sp. NPDC001076]
MPFSTTISALDLSGGLAKVRLSAGYVWEEVGGSTAEEKQQTSYTLDVTDIQFLSQAAPVTFEGSLEPLPSPAWFIAMWIQEIPAISSHAGWIFRSGGFSADPPSLPLEVILAPEELVGDVELAGAVGSLPITAGTTTINTIGLTVMGADISLAATGTDSRLPGGDTFTYTATLVLMPNSRILDTASPFEIRLDNTNLTFTAGTGHGLETSILNALRGLIDGIVKPQVRSTLQSLINSAVLSTVATRLNLGMPSAMPAGVVLSVRQVRGTTRATSTGTESVIGIRTALGAFDGVLNKFPALTPPGRRICPITAAALTRNASDVAMLRAFRDHWLRGRPGGQRLIAGYERLGPPLARFIERSDLRRAAVRTLLMRPAAQLARWLLDLDPTGLPPSHPNVLN